MTLKTVVAKLYEGMFLVDSAIAASDFEGVNNTIRGILEKAGAEIISMKKWDERRLAYDIKGKSRGTYILVFFRVDGTKVGEIERAVQLSEQLLRVLILNAESMGEDHMDKETPAMAVEQASNNSSNSNEEGSESDSKQEESGQDQKQEQEEEKKQQ
jgi:small subunit ribosomal protein S6